jgi:hypothetical protein
MSGRLSSSSPSRVPAALVIRGASPDDAAALERLAALDSRRPLRGSVLLAERDGQILAALGTADGRTVADPFAPTADLIALLRLRAADTADRGGRRQELLRRVGANTRRRPAFARG